MNAQHKTTLGLDFMTLMNLRSSMLQWVQMAGVLSVKQSIKMNHSPCIDNCKPIEHAFDCNIGSSIIQGRTRHTHTA